MKPIPDSIDYRSLMANALVELERMESKLREMERGRSEPVAIVGLGCRFPGADNPESFWQLLLHGKDAVREVPSERWDSHYFYDANPDTPGKTYARHSGFVGRLHDFDAQFFSVSPREAAS